MYSLHYKYNMHRGDEEKKDNRKKIHPPPKKHVYQLLQCHFFPVRHTGYCLQSQTQAGQSHSIWAKKEGIMPANYISHSSFLGGVTTIETALYFTEYVRYIPGQTLDKIRLFF